MAEFDTVGILESKIWKNNKKKLFTQSASLKRIASLLHLPDSGCQVVEHKSRKSSLVCAVAANKAGLIFVASTLNNAASATRGSCSTKGDVEFPAPPKARRRSRSRPSLATWLCSQGVTTFSSGIPVQEKEWKA